LLCYGLDSDARHLQAQLKVLEQSQSEAVATEASERLAI